MANRVTVGSKKLSLEEFSSVAFVGAKVTLEPLAAVELHKDDAARVVTLPAADVSADNSYLSPVLGRAYLLSRVNFIVKHAGLRSAAVLETLDFLVALLNADLIPQIPAPTTKLVEVDAASIALLEALKGHGKATLKSSKIVTLTDGLTSTSLTLPSALSSIEQATLTQGGGSLQAVVASIVSGAKGLAPIADAAAALTCEALKASPAPFQETHDASRPHRGMLTVATNLRVMLDNSKYAVVTEKVDPLAIRSIPQYHGPARDTIAAVAKTVEADLNAPGASLGLSSFHPELLKQSLLSIHSAVEALFDGSRGRVALLPSSISPAEAASKVATPVAAFLLVEATAAQLNAEVRAAQSILATQEATQGGAGKDADSAKSAEIAAKQAAAEAKEDEALAAMSEAQRAKVLEKRRQKAEKLKEKAAKKAAKDSLSAGVGSSAFRSFLASSHGSGALSPFDFRVQGAVVFLEELYARLSGLSGGQKRRPKIAKGAQDFLPPQMHLRERIFHKVRAVFKRHGGVEIETPVFELKETLTGKYGEDSKLIYDLADQGGELLALRYDLTVPFARFMALHNPGNMKRYAIARVYRRDNPQIARGRFREFYQCDFDIAGVYPTMLADAEVISIGIEVLQQFPELGPFKIKLSHRKLLDAILEICGVPADKLRTTCSAIDKLDKEPWENVRAEMVDEKDIPADVADRIQGFVTQVGHPKTLHAQLVAEKRFGDHPAAAEAMKELALLWSYLEAMGVLDFVSFDLSLARGLDYYTGLIYEFVLTGADATQVGSIAAGGRYDNLVGMFSATNAQIPCIGVSLGIERIFGMLQKHAENHGDGLKTPVSQVLVTQTSAGLLVPRLEVCQKLWAAHIAAEILPSENPKFVKQLQHALDTGIPYIVVLGEDEIANHQVKVKVLATKEEVTIDENDLIATLRRFGVATTNVVSWD
ncbi:histidine-tRNA ligase [Aphanomyces invadans]|uniref:Histidine--tRNA ligase, cytoplasmic n=1 Tax=Aphanomyces invadans TaxID=157072 RepID=A0A024U5N7_9STRA|nr:histidine-tRNA ligase [Aphanomyces invadans]ETW01584.1 histidine-tRNA ligase [Aphanomyces invadans]RHY33919.1 hypothetical protein DYB32_001321 [Aphanomyces invadans]|eukprot:XP_008869432.1 histidine-tRNA ligase [Aphanomyces invadans]